MFTRQDIASAYKEFKSNPDISDYENIIDYVNNLNPSLVIDAGCADNIFKGTIKNIIGFDARPTTNTDFVGTYQDMDIIFKSNSADAVICLGSLGYGTKEYIGNNIRLVHKWLKPGGVFFVSDIPDKDITQIDRKNYPNKFFWNINLVQEFTEKYKFNLIGEPVTHLSKLNWVWQKYEN